nr:putative disease resistance protein [Drimia wightii]
MASRDCTVEKLQDQVVKRLDLKDTEQIFSYLSNKSFVLLLDDVWDPLDLKRVDSLFLLAPSAKANDVS